MWLVVVLGAGVAPIGGNTEQNKVLSSRVTGLEELFRSLVTVLMY